MHYYHRDAGPPRCALKIDIRKAYDSVNWEALFAILRHMGTHTHLLNCIVACVTTPMFSVAVNGELAGFFAGKKGLRQGDPMSPFLFVIVMEVLSRSLSRATMRDDFDYHFRCEKVSLSHLYFADDLFLFAKATSGSVQIFMDVLKEFAMFSGLHINPAKSDLFISGASDSVKDDIVRITGINLGCLPMRYLGVP
ncbi:RNA-directed DNA polymerase, partial [Modestobacter italicus]|uniref:RNA-directed DNA polymerase n=1 Tax=Modestobacter italicus (strain DSM 44449 / CECT 9708 / BC 501) TaxID=2732864 RepID=UPI001C98DF9E